MNGENSFGFRKSAVAIGALCAALVCAPTPVSAKTAVIKTVVVTPLSFVKVDDLHFGQMMASNQNGFVTLNPNSSRSSTNGIILVGSAHHPAKFAGYGLLGHTVLITINPNFITLTGPGQNMRADQFTIGSTPSALLSNNKKFITIRGTSGAFEFPVGARLRVNAGQVPGVYSGTWNITAIYQ
jgi:Domain of unknown function (DUF4402)